MALDAPVLIGTLACSWTILAVLFWGSIAFILPRHPSNSFGWALVWAAAELAVWWLGIGMDARGRDILVLWILCVLPLLIYRYELEPLHAVGVVITSVIGPYFVARELRSFVGASPTLVLIALYGIPLAVLAAWRWPRRAPAAPTDLPEGRLVRRGRKREARTGDGPSRLR